MDKFFQDRYLSESKVNLYGITCPRCGGLLETFYDKRIEIMYCKRCGYNYQEKYNENGITNSSDI